jgi:hypothetical protein
MTYQELGLGPSGIGYEVTRKLVARRDSRNRHFGHGQETTVIGKLPEDAEF